MLPRLRPRRAWFCRHPHLQNQRRRLCKRETKVFCFFFAKKKAFLASLTCPKPQRMLANAPWLTADRARAWCAVLGLAMLAFLAWVAWLTLAHAAAPPVALDFAAFWAAAKLAVSGHAAAAYDNVAIEATERAATVMPPGYLAFYYPPTFLLLVAPLGWLGYSAALAVFLAAETVLVVALLRRVLPQAWSWLPLLACPGFFMNGLSGQNAALSASCFAAGAVWLERRPILAGAALGGLACKPQLAVCVPVALLAARRWRALAACGASALTLAVLSWAVLGAGVWRGFLGNAGNARADIETIAIKWPKMQSLFGAIKLAGGGVGPAYAAQGVLSVLAVATLAWVAGRRPGARLEVAALTTAALLFTPFLYDYDLALLAVPLACLAALAQVTGWLAWEKLLAAALFLLPLAARACGLDLGLVIGPPLVAGLLAIVCHRVLLQPRAMALTAA